VQHVHNQLKVNIESHGHDRENEQTMDADSDDGFGSLSRDDLRQLFVKHRSGEVVFFCDLGELLLSGVKAVYLQGSSSTGDCCVAVCRPMWRVTEEQKDVESSDFVKMFLAARVKVVPLLGQKVKCRNAVFLGQNFKITKHHQSRTQSGLLL